MLFYLLHVCFFNHVALHVFEYVFQLWGFVVYLLGVSPLVYYFLLVLLITCVVASSSECVSLVLFSIIV